MNDITSKLYSSGPPKLFCLSVIYFCCCLPRVEEQKNENYDKIISMKDINKRAHKVILKSERDDLQKRKIR